MILSSLSASREWQVNFNHLGGAIIDLTFLNSSKSYLRSTREQKETSQVKELITYRTNNRFKNHFLIKFKIPKNGLRVKIRKCYILKLGFTLSFLVV